MAKSPKKPPRAPLITKCIFWEPSKSHVPLDREHIFGDWLRDYVRSPANKHNLKATTIGTHATLHVSRNKIRPGEPLQSRLKIVCKTCNSGWMSGIQQTAKPFLIPLIQGRRTTLTATEQKAIATWCAMTAMTGEFLSLDPTAIAISQKERDWLRDHGSPPDNWKIWIGHRPSRNSFWNHYIVPLNAKNVLNLSNDSLALPDTQTTTFIIGNLFVHIFSSTGDPSIVSRWSWSPHPGLYLRLPQIFPLKDELIVWPPQGLTDFEVEMVSDAVEDVLTALYGGNPFARRPHSRPPR